jgi:replicative DNA helicase
MTRNKRLDIKLSLEERRALEILAAREGQGISELARTLIREAIEKRGVQAIGLINLLYPDEVENEQAT